MFPKKTFSSARVNSSGRLNPHGCSCWGWRMDVRISRRWSMKGYQLSTPPSHRVVRWDRGSFSLMVYRYSNPMEILFCLHLYSKNVIATKFCTCHDSCAVVACAKFCSDWMAKNFSKANFSLNLNCDGKNICEISPKSRNKKLRPDQNGYPFARAIFKCLLAKE